MALHFEAVSYYTGDWAFLLIFVFQDQVICMSINVVIRTKLKSVFNQHVMVKTAMSINGIYEIKSIFRSEVTICCLNTSFKLRIQK